MHTFWQDVKYGLRTLRKTPGFTAVAVITLALGIGANTAIFSAVKTMLVLPLPYAEADRVLLVLGWDLRRDQMRFNMHMNEFVPWWRSAESFEQAAAYQYWSVNLTGVDQAERLQGYRVTANTFELLGVRPLLGRTFRPEEGRPGAAGVVVLEHGLWQRRFGADPGIVGRALVLNDEPFEVIGVMPEKFAFPQFNYTGDLWVPMRFDPAQYALGRPAPSVVSVARLKRGVSLEQAQAEMDAVFRRLEEQAPETQAGLGVRLQPMQGLIKRETGAIFYALLGAVGFVLLIACANVANLMLSRALGREREMAVRAALGAGRGRLARQLMTESLLLAAAGGALGLALASFALDALRSAYPDYVLQTTPAVLEIGLHRPVLLFALGVSLGTGLLFGLAPALRASRASLTAALKEGGQASARSGRLLARGLVVAEVALSLVLLAGAGLMLRTALAVASASPGFDPENVLVMEMALPEGRYPDEPARQRFFERLVEEAAGLPGVEAAGVVNRMPFSTSNTGTSFTIAGKPAPAPGEVPETDYREITPDYFRALRIPLLEGRGFTRADSREAAPVVVVNRELAEQFFPGETALGKQIRFGGPQSDGPWRTIVGVVGNVHHWSIRAVPRQEVYVPVAQAAPARAALVVRTAQPPMTLAPAVRQRLRAIDPDQPVYAVEPMTDAVGRTVFLEKFAAALLSVFAAVALLLAAVGLYGVLAYNVARRTREIGIRMALGAGRGDVFRLVIGQCMALVGAGVALGLVGAIAVSSLLRSLLYGISPYDAVTFAGVALLLAAVAAVACWIPARRATRTDPLVALRYE